MKDTKNLNRRSFMTKSVVAGGAATGAMLAAPAVLAQAPLVIKMQTSWNDANIWQDFARDYATRVEEMSGGRVKVDVLPAGAVVAVRHRPGFRRFCHYDAVMVLSGRWPSAL